MRLGNLAPGQLLSLLKWTDLAPSQGTPGTSDELSAPGERSIPVTRGQHATGKQRLASRL